MGEVREGEMVIEHPLIAEHLTKMREVATPSVEFRRRLGLIGQLMVFEVTRGMAGREVTVRELLEHFPGEVLRFALLSAHYRSALNFSGELLTGARGALDTFYGALRRRLDVASAALSVTDSRVFLALRDDMNTPEAIAALHAAASILNKSDDAQEIALAKAELIVGGGLLGLLQADPEAWFTNSVGSVGPSAEEIDSLVEERIAAKLNRDFERADQIRDDLEAQGVVLEDGPDGTQWRRRG